MILFLLKKCKQISDTIEDGAVEATGYVNGTPGTGMTVLTTAEWNALQGANTLSFKIRAISNEGTWLPVSNQNETPVSSGTIDSCQGCKFMYIANDVIDTIWSEDTPTVLTSGLSDNYLDVVAASGRDYFLGVKLNESNQVTNAYVCGIKNSIPFCLEGGNHNYVTDENYISLRSVFGDNNIYANYDGSDSEIVHDTSITAGFNGKPEDANFEPGELYAADFGEADDYYDKGVQIGAIRDDEYNDYEYCKVVNSGSVFCSEYGW